MKFVKHFKSSFFSALLECGPGKRVDDGVDTGRLVVSICNPSCCTVLDFFYCFMLFAKRGSQTVAEYSRIGHTKALYAVSLVFLFPIFRFLLRKLSVLFAFIADSVYVESPIQVVLYVYAKVFCCADVLQVVSM